jgi:hypothetical protein
MIDVFISHSSKDAEFADYLVHFLRLGLRLSSTQIRATSVEETQLRAGVKVNETLRDEIIESKVFIAVLSPMSIQSTYVLFELGARWGADKAIFPLLLPNLDLKQITPPLSEFHIVSSDRPGLQNLLREVGAKLQKEPESADSLEDQIRSLLGYKPSSFSPLSFAVLAYVVDKEFNFALLKDSHYKKIQPPGRRLDPNEYPHEIAHLSAAWELDLPLEELQFLPQFRSEMYHDTNTVPPPYQVQLEKNPHRTALRHYDFVYVFQIDRARPPLSIRASKEHKTEPIWYSIKEVEKLQDKREYGPHDDMLPTMRKIIEEFGP